MPSNVCRDVAVREYQCHNALRSLCSSEQERGGDKGQGSRRQQDRASPETSSHSPTTMNVLWMGVGLYKCLALSPPKTTLLQKTEPEFSELRSITSRVGRWRTAV